MSGFLYSLELKLEKLVPEWWFRAQAVVFMAKAVTPNSVQEENNSTMRWAIPEDSQLLVKSGISKEFVEAEFLNGNKVVLSEQGRELTGISWYAIGHHAEYSWLRVVLSDDELWNYDVWVSPSCRGQGMVGHIMEFSHANLSASGGGKIFSSIDRLNKSSIRAFSKAGYKKIGQIFYVKFRRWIFIWAGPFPRVVRCPAHNPLLLRIKMQNDQMGLDFQFSNRDL